MPNVSPHPFSFACSSSRAWKWRSGFLLRMGAMDATIRERWRQEVVSAEDWVQHIEQALPIQPGEAGGFLVRSTQSGLLGYLKPLNHNPNVPRAAYEKIASDLGYEAA